MLLRILLLLLRILLVGTVMIHMLLVTLMALML
jgi:hypothetical protein